MFRRSFLQPLFLVVAVGTQAPPGQVPANKILVRGAEPSASDRSTPVPEDGAIVKNVYQNRYLGISYVLPPGWYEPFEGPPPSDHGTYVLGQLVPGADFKGPSKGTVLFSAQDMFFARTPAANAKELIEYARDHLQSFYAVERPPAEVTIAGHSFARFDYTSPVAQLHWVVLATEIRCHAVQFVLSSRDPKLLEGLVHEMDDMTLPAEAGATAGKGGGDVPLCVSDYAAGDNVTARVDPVLTDHRFNAIPVRIIIDKRGRVRHVHILSAFPDQASTITSALLQWTFKPYVRGGKPVEVETGIMFGDSPRTRPPTTRVLNPD